MNPSLTAQQNAFFSKNGYLELEEMWSPAECQEMRATIAEIKATRPSDGAQGRDLWRDSSLLKNLLLSRKFSSLPLELIGKPALHLAFDHSFSSAFSLPRPTKLKDLFCIQGLACILICRFDETSFPFPAQPSLGLLPFPRSPGSLLIVQPHLLIHWPPSPLELYMIGYALPNSLFIQNSADPAATSMKRLGYNYGDPLKNEFHPLIQKK
jgi:hypothetical protein